MPPPLRLSVQVTTPGGRSYRWGGDDPDAANIPNGLRFSSTMPGGFETCDLTLPRKSDIEYADLERLSNVTVVGASGEVAWDGRLERVPRTVGVESSVSPGCVGHQAALDDDKTVQFLGVDIDQSSWGGMSVQRRINIDDGNEYTPIDGTSTQDETTGEPSVQLECTGPWTMGGKPFVEAWFNAKGQRISSLQYAWKKSLKIDPFFTDDTWFWTPILCGNDVGTPFDIPGNLRAPGPGFGILNAAGDRYFAAVQLRNSDVTDSAQENFVFDVWWTLLAVYGDHGITKRGTSSSLTDGQGFFASDIINHVVPRFAPQLRVTGDSVQGSGFVIPHFSFLEPTTCAELVRQATRVGLQDWGVWEDRTFWWTQPGSHGRKWRARTRPAQLSETGPQVDRLWNGVVVQYQDVDGSSRTVGPPGSGATLTDGALVDADPENPANKANIRRWDLLQMPGTATAAVAVSVGQMFLSQSRLLDSSGQAQLVGVVEDDCGVLQPAWKVRAGDQITFVDAADNSYRKIVRADYSHDSRTCSVDLDAPPEGLSVLLERLGVVLIPLGLN